MQAVPWASGKKTGSEVVLLKEHSSSDWVLLLKQLYIYEEMEDNNHKRKFMYYLGKVMNLTIGTI